MSALAVEALTWSAQARRIVEDVSLRAEPGSLVGLLGPNGSGKSSLLRCIAQLRRPDAGRVAYDGRSADAFDRRALARTVAVVDQEASTEVDVRLRDVVALGRVPHRDRWGGLTARDEAAVDQAMAQVRVGHLADRRWSTLSGGERQRAHLARGLAQGARCLLLDEPTNHLDVRHQLELFALLDALPVTTVAALHDLPLAARFCDRVVLLESGRVVADGPPAEALTPTLIERVYGVRVSVAPAGTAGGTAGRAGVVVTYLGLA
ncbi:ABC transporter ATP-binding protein [Motilibacter aurantiacus]|uniref:ABC transporter ATP-binding protein n=1 Tax=Motilibacter aurantiacus TaxID=2714955 RepID=UPI00140AABC1|nr:ABC transporter ATP-binding protein [Motilibacter aurantiacus]NHC47506.1 ABC transporter ATP-binding protein [Motilibacter aurantiacus]